MDIHRINHVKERFPTADTTTVIQYLELREEGYSQFQAEVMAGLSDPPEEDNEFPELEDVIAPKKLRGYVECMGLPVDGIDHIDDGIHRIPSFSILGTTYQPCYIQVSDDVITHYGPQTHLMRKI
jgi:hypothetical protein